MSPPKKHVVFITFPAFGHIIPLLELARKVAEFHHVTFVVSASKVAELQSKELITKTEDGNFRVYGLEHGSILDENNSEFSNTPGVDRLLAILQHVEPAIADLLAAIPTHNDPHAKTDLFQSWLPVDAVIAERFVDNSAIKGSLARGIPCHVFQASAGLSTEKYLDIDAVTPLEPGKREADRQFFVHVNEYISDAASLIFNSFRELDAAAFDRIAAHPKLRGMPVRCVGPILPRENTKPGNAKVEQQVVDWLNKQAEKSVVYISFGSIASLSAEQLKIFADALTNLGKPFVWTVDRASQAALPEHLRENLGSQFEESSTTKGLVLAWSPQKAILKHTATALFVTHAGWNSTMESLIGSVPMVAWPMFADQFENAKWLANLKAAFWIPDTKIAGGRSVPQEEIEEAIQKVSGNSQYREAAEKLSRVVSGAIAVGGSSHRDFMELIKFETS